MADLTIENAASSGADVEMSEAVPSTGGNGAPATATTATAGGDGGAAAAVGATDAPATAAVAATAAAKAAAATPNAAAAAAAQPPRPFNLKWLLSADKNRQHFSDELFNTTFSQENVEKVVQELKTLTTTKIANSYRLCEDDHTYSLQIVTHGWLRVPTHLTRIELPYSVLADDSSVCLFVRDLKKPPQTPGRQAKSPNLADLTVRHYEQLLAAAKIDTSNVTVMPLSVLFNEHISLDQRRKLTYLYDKFIVEAPVATRVNAFLGAKLLFEGRAAFPVDLRAADLAGEWDVVLRQVFYQSHQAIDHVASRPYVCVGRESQDSAQVAENIVDLLGQLGALQPGGAPNISQLYLRASGNVATAVTLYKDPATSAPAIPAPAVAAPVLVKNADGTETPLEAEKLTVNVPNQTQHIIDYHHYIVYDGEDDYTEEFGADPVPQRLAYQQRGAAHQPMANGGGADSLRRRTVAANQQQQTYQQRPGQQNVQVARGTANTARKVVGAVAAGQTAATSNVDQLVLRGLQKLLAQPNIGNLMAAVGQNNGGGGGGNVRRMQQNGNNGGYVVARRPANQQQQQQQQQYVQQQQRGGIVGRNQIGGNVQRRRNVNQQNGGNGIQRNNRRFI